MMIKLTRVIGPAQPVYDEEDQVHVEVEEKTGPVWVETTHIRSVYPRRNEKPGSRLTFANSAGMAVTEAPERVVELMGGAGLN